MKKQQEFKSVKNSTVQLIGEIAKDEAFISLVFRLKKRPLQQRIGYTDYKNVQQWKGKVKQFTKHVRICTEENYAFKGLRRELRLRALCLSIDCRKRRASGHETGEEAGLCPIDRDFSSNQDGKLFWADLVKELKAQLKIRFTSSIVCIPISNRWKGRSITILMNEIF